jgi:hypothetical protein
MGMPDNREDFEEYSSGELRFFIHKEIWETRDLSKGELVIRIEGYGRYTLKLGK